MKLTYSLNPQLPRLRARAVDMVREGNSIRSVATYFGFDPATVCRWVKKAPANGCWTIPTTSSRPHHHPKELASGIVQRIKDIRGDRTGRCAEAVHGQLIREGVQVSLSSVKRTLDRLGLTQKRTRYKHHRVRMERPVAAKPGDLVQVDTIHLMTSPSSRIYVYTLLDVHSRWAFARASQRINAVQSTSFLKKAQVEAPFAFTCIQSDNGPEFSQYFSEHIRIVHRHSRVRTPNDNAHLERFNRTIQYEFLRKHPLDPLAINKALPQYLKHYNEQRLHLGLGLKTPAEIINECCKGID